MIFKQKKVRAKLNGKLQIGRFLHTAITPEGEEVDCVLFEGGIFRVYPKGEIELID